MLVSIGIPAYNSEKHLRSTIQSVLDQTMSNWELIIVDDGSTDSTSQIVTEYAGNDSRIRLVKQDNHGLAATRNRAFAEMSPESPYVMFLDHDDELEPDALTTLIAALEADANAVAAYGQPRFINSEGELLGAHPTPGYAPENRLRVSGNTIVTMDLVSPTDFAVFAAGDSIVTPGMVLMRRSSYVAAGGWDADASYIGCDDLDLWFRLTLLGYMVFLPTKVIRYRLHSTNLSNNVRMMRRSERSVRRKILAISKSMPERTHEIQVGYRLKELRVARDKVKYASEMCRRMQLVNCLRELMYGLAHLLRGYRGLVAL